jgi:hypothetical protein
LSSIVAVLCSTLPLTGCDPNELEASTDEADPPYQDLDAGDQWPPDTDTDHHGSELDCIDHPCGDAGSDGGAEGDAGTCLNIDSESYQVSGSCPGLPTTGSVLQDEGCAIEIPGELGSVLGETGTVNGPYVTTTACTGLAEVDELPSVELTCVVDDASCQALLAGGTESSFND